MAAERLREWTEDLCAKASPGFQNPIRRLLRELFPELARAYANTTYGGGHHAQWRKNCRVGSSDVFDKFFLLAIPVGEISEVEMAAFVDGLADVDLTSEALKRARVSGRARRLLERLEDYIGELPTEHVAPLVKVLFDLGDGLRFQSRGFLDVTADMQIARITYQSLRRLKTEDERLELLLRSVQEGTALYTLVEEVSLSEPTGEEPEVDIFTDHERWLILRDAAVARIRAANEDGKLWSLEKLPYVLFRWLQWTTETEVLTAVSTYVTEDDRLVAFIGHFVSEIHSRTQGDKLSQVHRTISKRSLGALLDLDPIITRLRAIHSGVGENAAAAGELVRLIEANGGP